MFEKKEARKIKVTIRFTESEKIKIEEHIFNKDFQNISEFIRYLIKKEIN